MNPLVEKLEKRLMPEFEKIAGKIRREIPDVSAGVESHSFGFDQYLGHSINISCLLLKNCFSEADHVALCVSLSRLSSVPKIDAEVGWGNPSGYSEAEFSDQPLEVSETVLEDLYKNLPGLYGALFRALRRRKPADE